MPKKIARIVVTILTFLYILAVIPLSVSGIFGIHPFVVTSGSMSPEIPTASLILSKKTPFEKLKAGDVITFMVYEEQTATHRIVSIDKTAKTFSTKGDAIDQKDSRPVSYENVVGKVIFHMPKVGYLLAGSDRKSSIIMIAGMGLMLFALNFLLEEDRKKLPSGSEPPAGGNEKS